MTHNKLAVGYQTCNPFIAFFNFLRANLCFYKLYRSKKDIALVSNKFDLMQNLSDRDDTNNWNLEA
jgi:hypothetical protein